MNIAIIGTGARAADEHRYGSCGRNMHGREESCKPAGNTETEK